MMMVLLLKNVRLECYIGRYSVNGVGHRRIVFGSALNGGHLHTRRAPLQRMVPRHQGNFCLLQEKGLGPKMTLNVLPS